MNGQDKEYKEIQTFFDGLLLTKAALLRLRCDMEGVHISMKSGDFEHLSHVIEMTDEHHFKKFYKRIDKDTFSLANFIVKR